MTECTIIWDLQCEDSFACRLLSKKSPIFSARGASVSITPSGPFVKISSTSEEMEMMFPTITTTGITMQPPDFTKKALEGKEVLHGEVAIITVPNHTFKKSLIMHFH